MYHHMVSACRTSHTKLTVMKRHIRLGQVLLACDAQINLKQ